MQIYNNEDLNIWRHEDAVSWIDFKCSIPVECIGIKIYFFIPMSVEITVAVEPYEYESLGKLPTEGGIELILPLFDNEGWPSWIDQTELLQ